MSFHSGLSGYLDTHHGQIDSIPSEGSPPKGGWFAVGEKKSVRFLLVPVRRQQIEDSTKILQRGFRRLRQRWHLVMTVKNFNPREWRDPVPTYLESRWRNPHVLVYHGPLLIHLLGVAPCTFTTVYIRNAPKPPLYQIHFSISERVSLDNGIACNFTLTSFHNCDDFGRFDSTWRRHHIKGVFFSHFFIGGRRLWKDGCFINPGGVSSTLGFADEPFKGGKTISCRSPVTSPFFQHCISSNHILVVIVVVLVAVIVCVYG